MKPGTILVIRSILHTENGKTTQATFQKETQSIAIVALWVGGMLGLSLIAIGF